MIKDDLDFWLLITQLDHFKLAVQRGLELRNMFAELTLQGVLTRSWLKFNGDGFSFPSSSSSSLKVWSQGQLWTR